METLDEPDRYQKSEGTRRLADVSAALTLQSFEAPPAPVGTFREGEHLIAELLIAIEHEFRTPLAVIQGYNSMLLRHEQQLSLAERQEYHAAIEQASTRMARLLEQVLELAQLEAGAVHIDQGIVDIPPLVREAIAKARQQVPETLRERVTFHLHVRDAERNAIEEAPLVQGDPRSVYKIVMQVLENAIRFSPQGGRIDVIVQPVAPERVVPVPAVPRKRSSFLELCICDYGIGIPEEHLERVFERFYRVETALSRETPSLGLGLAVCQHLVALHQGRIWAES